MIGMALFAVLVCVNFISCDKESGGNSPTNQPVNEKKLVRITHKEYTGSTRTIDFKYDENGNVIKVEHSIMSGSWSEVTDTIEYIWNSNKSLTWNYECTLNNAKITEMSKGSYEIYCEYNNNGNLIEYGDLKDGTIRCIYAWDNNQLENITGSNSVITLSYESQTCKGFFPLLIDYAEIYCSFSDRWAGCLSERYIFMAQPELLGIKTNSLPSEINYSGYTMLFDNYAFDSDGYVTRCSVSQQWDNGTNYGNDIYKFVWE